MRVCYLIQTHKNPSQVCRLIKTLKKASPHSFILINHDYQYEDFPVSLLECFSDVAIIAKTAQGFRSDFSLVQAYLDSITWLLKNAVDFDWLVNLSGEDYPIKSPVEFEQMLANRQDDGFAEYFEVLSPDSPWRKMGIERYYYQYLRWNFPLKKYHKFFLKPIQIILDRVQPWIRMNLAYGLSIGFKAKNPPFNSDFPCYGASFFHVLSRQAILYLHQYSQANPQLIAYYQRTLNPDESYIDTILMNASSIKISYHRWMYVDFTNTKGGHPQYITEKHYPELIQSCAYFARKFDVKNEDILDLFDRHIFA